MPFNKAWPTSDSTAGCSTISGAATFWPDESSGLDQKPGTRRFFYFIPAQGEPRKLVHRIEAGALDDLPGAKTVYLPWQELEAGVADSGHGMPAGGDGIRPAGLAIRTCRGSTPA